MSDQPPPPGGGLAPPPPSQPPEQQPPQEHRYPQQALLPQQVQPGRSRMPLFVGLAVLLVLVGGGVAAWLLLRDDGESTRAQYCAAIKTLAPNDDLMSAVLGADAATADQAKKLVDLAPDAVDKDWQTLSDLVASAATSSANINPTSVIAAFGALRRIVQDSNDKCGTAYTLPLSG